MRAPRTSSWSAPGWRKPTFQTDGHLRLELVTNETQTRVALSGWLLGWSDDVQHRLNEQRGAQPQRRDPPVARGQARGASSSGSWSAPLGLRALRRHRGAAPRALLHPDPSAVQPGARRVRVAEGLRRRHGGPHQRNDRGARAGETGLRELRPTTPAPQPGRRRPPAPNWF